MKSFQLLTTFAIFFFCNPIFAQKKTIPGYYITEQGDTVNGVFPKYAQWTKNPSHIEFIIDGATNQILLTPQNTRKFVVEGYDEYVSYTGKRLVNPIEDAVLIGGRSSVGSSDSSENVISFLRLVKRTTGGNLYILNDAQRTNFFYQLPGQPLTELRYKKSFSQNQIIERADYRQQLNYLFAKIIVQKNLVSTLEKLPYDEKRLSSFFQVLFPAEIRERKKQGGGTTWVVSAGAVMNMVSVKAGKGFDWVPRNYAPSFSPLLGIGFIVPIGRNFGKYFFYPQLKLFQYKNKGEENQGTFLNVVTYKASLAAKAQVRGGVNIVNQESRRIFITGGVGLFGQLDGKQVKQRLFASDRTPYLTTAETKLAPLSYSIEVSIGAELNKKIRLSANYTVPAKIASFVFYEPRLSGIQLEVGYKL
jgi:hypothetical protein